MNLDMLLRDGSLQAGMDDDRIRNLIIVNMAMADESKMEDRWISESTQRELVFRTLQFLRVPAPPAIPGRLVGATVLSENRTNPFPDSIFDPLAQPLVEVFVVAPITIHSTEKAEPQVDQLVEQAWRSLESLRVSVDVQRLEDTEFVGPYSIVVVDGEEFPAGLPDRAAKVDLRRLENPSLKAILQQALAQWTARPIGQILLIRQLQDGRLAIYV